MDMLVYHVSNMPLVGSLGYLLAVYTIHKAMSSRAAPVTIAKPILVLYNFVQVAINLYVAYDIAMALGGRVWGLGLKDTTAVRYGVWLHYLCKVCLPPMSLQLLPAGARHLGKPALTTFAPVAPIPRGAAQYLDMFDTLIIVLRKKSEQLSFLHLWHHSTIVVVWGWVVNTWPAENSSAAYAYGAWVNSCVHVIMCVHIPPPAPGTPVSEGRSASTSPPVCSVTADCVRRYFYYGLTAMNIRPPFKKLVTMVQLTQFASCIIHAITALFVDVTPVFYNGVQVLYHIGMLKLFLPLLLGKKPSAKKA